jgi:RHS repeat-associated protein
VWSLVFLALLVSTESASADQLALPLPSFAQVGSWLSHLLAGEPVFSGLPVQVSGTAAGHGHSVPAAATRARGGAGHLPGHGRGELAGYAAQAWKTAAGPSAAVKTGFDARTSKLVGNKSTARMSYFQNADGSVTRDYAQTPVNYQDSSGDWDPINPTVVLGTDQRWHEQANSVEVSFANSAADPDLASFAPDSAHSMSYSLTGSAPVQPTVAGADVTYPAVLPDTDLTLSPTATGMKESLVLDSASAASNWVFPLTLNGVRPVLNDAGGVDLVDTGGRVQATIPRAYAYDSQVDPTSGDPATTYAVDYSLITVNGGPALKIALDPTWLADPQRVFPVTVDPTFLVTPASTYTERDSGSSNNNYDRSMEMTIKIGSYNSGGDVADSFLKFPSDLDGSGVTVNSATLQLFDTWASICTAERFDVAPVNSSWTPSGVTTYPGPAYGASIGNLTPTVSHACANRAGDRTVGDWVDVPLATATIQGWANGTTADNGLAVYGSTTDANHWKQFDSSNMFGYAPELSVTTTGNVPPQVDTMYPGNDGVVTSLTPTLIATGHDIDATGGEVLKYDFKIENSSSAVVVDSGLVSSGNWTVPASKLSYGQTYYWTVQANDGSASSAVPGWNAMSVQVPQPAITSSLSQNDSDHGLDPSTGNYTTSTTDADVPTVGPSLSVERDYNSRDPRVTGAFGAGWSSLFDTRATEQKDTAGNLVSVVVTYPDGSEVGYGRNPDGTFAPPLGRFATFKSITGGYSLTDKNDTVYTFTQAVSTGVYGLTAIADANGRTENVTWSGGQISTVTSAVSGRALHLTWTTPSGATAAHVATVTTDPVTAGQPSSALTWTYAYTGDQLASVCPPGTSSACAGYGYTTASQYRNQVLDATPNSFWPLGESSGTVAHSSMLGNEGADNGTYANVALGQPGPLAGSTATAAGFNGTTSYVQLPRSLAIGTSTQAISLWFKTSSPNGVLFSYSALPLNNSYSYTTGFYTPALYIGTDGKLAGEFWTGNLNPIRTSTAVDDGNWHQVVLAAGGNSQSLYLDGNLVGSLAGSVSVVGQTNDYLGGGYIGGAWPDEANQTAANNNGEPMYFTGSLADATYTGKVMTAAQVQALYTAGTHSASLLTTVTRASGKNYASISYDPTSATVTQLTDENGGVWHVGAPTVSGSSQVYRAAVMGSGPSAYYRLGDAAGSASANDEVKFGAATYANTTLGVAGPFADATAASFNGSTSAVHLPANSLSTTHGAVSAELWFKTTATGGGIMLGATSTGTSCTSGEVCTPILWLGSDHKLHGAFWTTSTAPALASAGTVNDGNWHHAVITASNSNQTLYLDGTQAATATSSALNLSGQTVVSLGTGTAGQSWGGLTNNTTQPFTGSLAEAALFPATLSAQDVTAHYQAARNSQGLAPMTTVQLTDPGNKALTYDYDTLNGNRLIAQIDALGDRTTYGYDTAGFLHTVTDPDGDVTTTGHDVRGNTVSQTTCQNQATNTCATAYYTYYPDDTTAQLTTTDPRNDLPLTVRDGRSASATDNTYLTTYGYDSAGDRTTITTPPVPGFPAGRTTMITYSDGTSTYPAADSGNVPAGLPIRTTSAGGATETISYFHSGDVATATDADGLVTRFSYDGLGRLANRTEVSDTYPAGLTTSYTYDGQNQVVTQTDPPITDRVTGAIHTAVTTTSYDPDGDILSQTVADGTGGDAARTTSSTYDAHDQVATETDQDNNTTSTTYDAYGNKATETGPDHTETDWTHDPNGNVLTEGIWSTGSPLNPHAATFLTQQSSAYDPAGRLASVTDSMGNTSSYTYFDNGLTATVTRTDSAGQNPFVLESDSYDAAGNPIRKVTNNGATVEAYSVDAADRTTQTVQDPGALARTTTVSYTPDDQAATTTQTDASGTDRTTSSSYDPMGNLLSQTVYGDSVGHPIGWWQLNQNGGSTVPDASGSGNTATASGGATLSGGAATFPGTVGAQVATNGPVLNTTASFSVSAWVDLSSTAPGFQTALSQDGNQASSFYLQYDATDNAWAFARSNTDTNGAAGIRVHASTPPATNTWTHLVGLFNAGTGSMSLYVNGALAATGTDSTAFAANGPLAIGRAKFNGAQTDPFHGQIANVQVYQRALSAADVTTLYNGGRTGGTTASSSTATSSQTLDQRGLPTSATDPDGNVTYYSYDEAGQLAVTTQPSVTTETNGGSPTLTHPVTTVGYNTFGEPVESQDPNGNITTTAYDAAGQAVSQTEPDYTPPGSSTPITATTVTTYDALGQVTAVSDPLNQTTHYTYDQLGNVVRQTDPLGHNTDSTFDTEGDVLSTTDPTGAQTQATYDYLGRELTDSTLERYPSAVTATTTNSYTASATNPDGAFLASTTSPDGAVSRYGYDNLGEQTSVTDAAGNTTKQNYTFLGDKQTTTLPDGTSSTVSYDPTENPVRTADYDASGTLLDSTSATYDGDGNKLTATDGRGYTTTFGYDATGTVDQEVQPVSANSSITTSFAYDANGNRTRMTDGRGNSWIYTYNSWDLPASTIEPATNTYSSTADRTFTTSYDADGQAVSQTQPGGVTLTAGYDADGDLTGQSGSGAEVPTASRTFGYDADGRMTSASTSSVGTSGSAGYQPASSETFTHNDRGELLTADGSAGSSSFSYNPDGLMTARTDAAGTSAYGYDTADRLASSTDAATGVQQTYSYNTLDQVSGIHYGSGDTRSFGYNSLHQLTSDRLATSGGATVASIAYGYDADGDLTTKTTTGFDGSAANTYTYDEADRLTSWSTGANSITYGYDASGNRNQVGANVYTYDARDELTSDGSTSYTYTARGTLSGQTSTTGTTATTSDAYGQMTSQGTQNYAYDALGRTLTDQGSTSHAFSYSGTDNTIATDGVYTYAYDPTGGLLGVGVAATNGTGAVTGTTAGSGVLALVDQHTDVVGEFAANGTSLTGSATYDPLGNIQAFSNDIGQLAYQSGWTDADTGKVNMASRWYSPATGQFMNRDTAVNNPVPNSAEANPFAYVDDNPLTGTDPTGHGLFSAISSGWNWFNKHVVKPAAHFVSRSIIKPLAHIVSAVKRVFVQPLVHAIKTTVHKVVDAYHFTVAAVKHTVAKVQRSFHTVTKAAVHAISTGYHKVAHAAATATKAVGHGLATAAKATTTFVKNNYVQIASISAGVLTFAGCEFITEGAGTLGCAALSGAAANGVTYLLSCGKTAAGCSANGALEAVDLGAATGLLGGALGGFAGPLASRLVSQALDGALPEVVVSAFSGAAAGAAGGGAGGAATYGLSCGTTKSGCSLQGVSSAAGQGAALGALFGGVGGYRATGRSTATDPVPQGNDPAPEAGSGKSTSTACHSFTGNTGVLMANGTTKPISQVKIGDKITNAVPGDSTARTNTVTNVIVTTTDHDFVKIAIKARAATTAKKIATTGLVLTAAAALVHTPSTTSTTTATLTTTYHHPFYDITQAAFVDAQHLHTGDQLQSANDTTATITDLHLYHANTTTYDLTIGYLHTYYVVAGSTPVLVHNCDGLENHASEYNQRIERQAAQQRGVNPTTIGEGAGLSGLQDALGVGTDFKWAVVAGDGGSQLRVMPAYAGGGVGEWPNIELAHTALTQPGEVVTAAGSGVVGDDVFPTTISNWSGHYRPPDSNLPVGEQAFDRAGIETLATPYSLLRNES